MPAMANITIKKADGTTDVVYTQVNASGGDQRWALWRNNSVGTAPAHRPYLRTASRDTQDGRQREVNTEFKYTQVSTNTTTGVTSVVETAFGKAQFRIPKGMEAAPAKEFAFQFGNLMASAMMKAVLEEGAAP